MKQAIISPNDGKNQIVIQSPFDGEFVRELKEKIPASARQWDPQRKVWLVAAEEEALALEIVRRHFEILDRRVLSADAIEEAQLASEIAQIKEDQQFVLGREEWIEKRIADLSDRLSRYSFNSRSRVRHGLAMDRALLQHALDNARLPVEQLTELQVRGLAAARRYIEGAT